MGEKWKNEESDTWKYGGPLNSETLREKIEAMKIAIFILEFSTFMNEVMLCLFPA